MPRDTQTGLLISFDGLDSSGKATQSRLLVDRLRFAGYRAQHFSSPDYTTPSGQELKERLQNKRGDWHKLPWEQKMRLFAANRAERKDAVVAAINRGEMVVYDRYVPSSIAFMTVEALNHHMTDLYRRDVQDAVKKQEYIINGMPREDVSIFLDVPARITCGLLAQRKSDHAHDDEYTDELTVQEYLYNEYDWLCDSDPGHYLRLRCLSGNELLQVNDIAELVWQTLAGKFPFLTRNQ